MINSFTSLWKKDYLLIIGHMRSYSTLLAHILGSNKEISGHSEMQISFQRTYDLYRFQFKILFENPKVLYSRYFLDKVLYNEIADSILKHHNVKVILLLRVPESTLKSIINMKENITKKDALFIKAENITDNPEEVLKHTGKAHYGDPSDIIKSGIINLNKRDYSSIPLDPFQLNRAQKAYDDCLEILSSECTTISGILHD